MSPLAKSAPSAVVGLDIGSDCIKVAEARCAKDGISITAIGVARTPGGVIADDVIIDPKGLGAAVKTLLSETGIKTRKCVASVSGQAQVVVRVIEVPKMQPEELAETMKWEIERHVPFSPQEVEYDFHALDRPGADPDAQEMEVLLAVAQQNFIAGYVETLEAAGLQPTAIDIEPLAAGRALINVSANGAKDEIVAIVNIGSTSTDVGIFENGILVFPSPPIGIAGLSFTREIAEALGQSLEQAEVSKKEYAAVDLNAFAAAAPPEPDFTPSPEPTQYDTVFSQPDPVQEEPVVDAGQDVAQDAAQDFGAFVDTPDGPVFDLGDQAGETASGPAFDLGGEQSADVPEAPDGPSFDLGADDTSIPGPTFDLGGDATPTEQAAAPDFDLDDTVSEPQPEEAQGPAFDLSDADAHADPGEQTFQQPFSVTSEPDSVQQQVFSAISQVLLDMADDLRRSMEYYSTKYAKMPSRVILCGGTAKMPKLDEFLSRELGVPVEVADPLKGVRANVPGASPQYLKEMSPLLPVSIGLAIRDMLE